MSKIERSPAVSQPELAVLPDPTGVAHSTAADAIEFLRVTQAERGPHGVTSFVITGGRTGIEVLKQIREHPALLTVDWSRVEIWWSDERHVPVGDPERNETQARDALLDYLDLDPELVHPAPWAPEMPVDVAAEALSQQLMSRPDPDLVLLGLGEDVHVGSLFPWQDVRLDDERRAIPVRDAPKPPPERISLSLPSIRLGREVWIVTAGASKAMPVHKALTSTDIVAAPAAGARGRERTRFIIDEAAAAQLEAGARS